MKRLISAVLFGCIALPVAAAQEPAKLPPTKIVDASVNAVVVQNDRDAAVTVYLETGVFGRRLGTVAAHDIQTLPLPSWAVNGRTSVRLFAHPADAPGNLATQQFTLRPPGRIGMRIPNPAMATAPSASVMTATLTPEELPHATITVDNPRDVPVTVYAATGPFDVRLGVVPPGERATLRFPKSVANPFNAVQIFVHPQGGFNLASQPMSVSVGQHLGLRVPGTQH